MEQSQPFCLRHPPRIRHLGHLENLVNFVLPPGLPRSQRDRQSRAHLGFGEDQSQRERILQRLIDPLPRRSRHRVSRVTDHDDPAGRGRPASQPQHGVKRPRQQALGVFSELAENIPGVAVPLVVVLAHKRAQQPFISVQREPEWSEVGMTKAVMAAFTERVEAGSCGTTISSCVYWSPEKC